MRCARRVSRCRRLNGRPKPTCAPTIRSFHSAHRRYGSKLSTVEVFAKAAGVKDDPEIEGTADPGKDGAVPAAPPEALDRVVHS